MKPVGGIAAVQVVGERAVGGVIFRKIGVEQIDRHGRAGNAGQRVSPSADLDAPAREFQTYPGSQRLQNFFRFPDGRLVLLISLAVEALPEVAFSVDQRNADDGHAEIGGRAEHIAGQDSEASGIRRQIWSQGDFHGEVGDSPVVRQGGGIGHCIWTAAAALNRTPRAGVNTQRQMLNTGHGESRTIEYSLDQTRLTIP